MKRLVHHHLTWLLEQIKFFLKSPVAFVVDEELLTPWET